MGSSRDSQEIRSEQGSSVKEKIHPIVTTAEEIHTTESKTAVLGRNWIPGLIKRFPLISAVAVSLILSLCASIIVVLVVSDGHPVETWCSGTRTIHILGHSITKTWTIPVNVWISLFVFLAGKLMALVFAEAATIAWWTSAMSGKTMNQLQYNWEASRSISAVFKNPNFKLINWITLGTLAFTAFSGLGTILQKATKGVTAPVTYNNVNMSVMLGDQYPVGFSGLYADQAVSIESLTSDFRQIVRDHVERNPIPLTLTGCPNSDSVTCFGTFQGVGLQYSCSATTKTLPPMSQGDPNWNKGDGSAGPTVVQTIWDIHLDWDRWQHDPYQINLTATWKSGAQCSGDVLQSVACSMAPALVRYPISVTKGVVTLAAPTSSISWISNSGGIPAPAIDEVVKILPRSDPDWVYQDGVWQRSTAALAESQAQDFDPLMNLDGDFETIQDTTNGFSTLGGLYKTLQDQLESTINLTSMARNVGGNFDQFTSKGEPTIYFAYVDPEVPLCEKTLPNPMDFILSQIRDIVFRSAVAIPTQNICDKYGSYNAKVINNTNICHNGQTVDPNARLVNFETVYQTNYTYTAIGAGLMFVSVLCMLPLFRDFWKIGRKVSLSPFEIAIAMHGVSGDNQSGIALHSVQPRSVLDVAASTGADPHGSNSDARHIMQSLGDTKVRYGEVAPGKLAFAAYEIPVQPTKQETYY